MLAARKQAQHAGGIGVVAGFAKYQGLYDDDCVGAQHKVIRPLAKYRSGFFPRHALGERSWRFSFVGDFGNIGWLYYERNRGVAQQLLAARGRGGEDKHAI